MATFRLTGVVHSTDVRSGQTKAGKDWSMRVATVKLAAFSFTEVTLADSLVVSTGEVVDLVCSVESSGGYLRAQAVDHWPSDGDAAVQVKPLAAVGGKS